MAINRLYPMDYHSGDTLLMSQKLLNFRKKLIRSLGGLHYKYSCRGTYIYPVIYIDFTQPLHLSRSHELKKMKSTRQEIIRSKFMTLEHVMSYDYLLLFYLWETTEVDNGCSYQRTHHFSSFKCITYFHFEIN